MKINILIIALCFTFSVPVSAELIKEKTKQAYIPQPQTASTAVIAGVATAHNSAFLTDATLTPVVHFGGNQPSYVLNHFKGTLGESLMDDVFTSSFLKGAGNWSKLTPASIGRNGIDGLYIKMDSAGNPRQLLVSDAKVNSAQLGMTKEGKQMSDSWIRPRVQQTSNNYRRLAGEMKTSKVVSVKNIPQNTPKRTIVQINDKVSAQVWKTPQGYSYYCNDNTIRPEQIQRQLNRTASYLQGVAEGKISYRSRLFSYKPDGTEHVVIIKSLNKNGDIIQDSISTIRGSFNKLPKVFQRAIRHTAVRVFGKQKNMFGFPKYSKEEIRQLSRKCYNDPEAFNRLCVNPKVTAPWIRTTVTIGAASALAATIDIATQYFSTGNVDWIQTGKITLLTGTSTGLGLAAGNGLQYLGCSSGLSRLAGGGVAAIGIAYGMYAMGYCSLTEANINAAAGIASAGAIIATPAIMMAIAATYGTASTGTAISSLGGAAMINASLAWWGGGAVTAGGAGVAGGSAVIGVAACSAAIIVLAIPAAYMTWKYFRDAKSQYKYLKGMTELTTTRVSAGNQAEWPMLRSAY